VRFEGAVGRLIQPRQQLHRTRALFAGDGDGRFQITAGAIPGARQKRTNNLLLSTRHADGDPGRRRRSQLNQQPRRTNNFNPPIEASNVLGAVTNNIAAEVGAEIETWLASLATTQIYTEVDAERLAKFYNSARPRA
jgi:hypothetical protein